MKSRSDGMGGWVIGTISAAAAAVLLGLWASFFIDTLKMLGGLVLYCFGQWLAMIEPPVLSITQCNPAPLYLAKTT